jgi:histidinol-phosphatase (PHP family)
VATATKAGSTIGNASLPPDYHVHLKLTPYTLDTIERIVGAARESGITEVAITEHLDRFRQAAFLLEAPCAPYGDQRPFRNQWWRRRMTEDLDAYVSLVLRAKASGIPVVLGVEAEYVPGTEEGLQQLLAAYPFDVVLGSVHWIGGWGVGLPEQRALWDGADVDKLYELYFSLASDAARAGLFDVLAHPDLIKIFGHRPDRPPVGLWNRLASAMRESSIAAEISTAGWRKPVAEIYPAQQLLSVLNSAGVRITLASDAHRPQDVGHRFADAIAVARCAGYSCASRFSRRVPQDVPL